MIPTNQDNQIIDQPLRYEDIRLSAPYHVRSRKRKVRNLKAWQSLLFFAVLMVVFIFVGSQIQFRLGMLGVAVNELLFLVSAILFTKLMHADMKAVFPIHKPQPLAFLGVIVLWIGCYLAITVFTLISLWLSPEATLQTSGSINALQSQVPPVLSFLIIAVLPAICEEAVHRGVILSGLKNSIGGKWLTVIFCGIIFGIFHIYPVRFLSTAFIGGVLAYLLITTDNMVYSCFLHFFHNAILILLSMLAASVNQITNMESLQSIQSVDISAVGMGMLIYGSAAPIILYSGAYLVRRAAGPKKIPFLPEGKERSTLRRILTVTFSIMAVGIIFIIL